MPEVYDPTGGSMFRSRFRRKRKVSKTEKGKVDRRGEAMAFPRSTSNRVPLSAPSIPKDPLEFIGQSCVGDKNGIQSLSPPSVDDRIEKREREKVELLSTTLVDGKMTSFTAKRKRVNPTRGPSGRTQVLPLEGVTGTATSSVATETPVATGIDYDATSSVDALVQYAIALDTRYLDTQVGIQDQNNFQRLTKNFLQTSFRRRGFSPSVVAWTGSRGGCNNTVQPHDVTPPGDCKAIKNPSKTPLKGLGLHKHRDSVNENIPICSKSLREDSLDRILLNVKGSPIQTFRSEQMKNNKAHPLPKGLMADKTWNIFGDLVEAAVNCVVSSSDPVSDRTPLRVIIFTSATSSLLDVNATGHIQGIDCFWEKVRCQFSNLKVQSVEIIFVMGDSVLVRTRKERCSAIQRNTRTSSDVDKENIFLKQPSDSKEKRSSVQDDGGSSEDASTETMHSITEESPGKQADAFDKILRYINIKNEEDFKMDRIRMHVDSRFDEKQSGTKITFSAINNTIDFHSLCQKWSRDYILAAVANGGRLSPVISFQLPETSSFDACDLSFSTYYKNMPFRLDSPQVKLLYDDLELLSKASLEVLQLIPISSIDESLIYGITIGLRATLEDDKESYQEKTMLVQSLFKNLAARDCALLIRSLDDPHISSGKVRRSIGNGGIFHSSDGCQYFLFMPEFIASRDGPASAKSGVLHRLTSVDHILEQSCSADTIFQSNMGKDSSLRENPFSEYVEASLDCLDCSLLNPWVQDWPNYSTSTSSTVDAQKDSQGKDSISSFFSKKRNAGNEEGQMVPTTNTGIAKESVPSNEMTQSFELFTDESGIGSTVGEIVFSGVKEPNGEKELSMPIEKNNNCKTLVDDSGESMNPTKHVKGYGPKLADRKGQKNRSEQKHIYPASSDSSTSTDESDASSNKSSFGSFDYGTE